MAVRANDDGLGAVGGPSVEVDMAASVGAANDSFRALTNLDRPYRVIRIAVITFCVPPPAVVDTSIA